MDKNYVVAFVEAVYPGHAALALASFNERKCLEDATARILELEAARCKHHIAMTMQHPCQACGRDWQAHSQSDAIGEQK